MNKLMRFSLPCLLAAGAVFVAAPAAAQFAKPEDAIKYRQSSFTLMSNHMGRLAAMARGAQPFDAAAAQQSARVVELVSHLPWDAFPAGSNGGAAKLKGDLWKDAATFTKLQDDLKAQVAKLPAAAASLESLRAQLGPTSGACKACHDQFRDIR